jgi:hypothetical protein
VAAVEAASPYVDGDLPEKPHGFFKLVGPGAVLVGLSIGAGELIVWPILTARFGASLVWAAVLGLLLQLIINIEVGRYTLASGESVYGGIARLSHRWVPMFLLLNVCGWILPGWARACAGAVKAMLVGPDGPGEPWLWTAITFASVGVVMFGPRHVYRYLEKITISLVVIMVLGLFVIAATVATGDAFVDLTKGIANFGHKPASLPLYELFSAIVFAGAGGTTNLMLSYYLRDKGWGMGALVRDEEGSTRAFSVIDTAVNRTRWRQWFNHMRADQAVFFWLMNTITILLFVLSALVVLYPAGIIPDREMLVLQEAAILETVWGRTGSYLFLAVGIACLFSTQLTLLDGVARSCADLLHSNYSWAARRPFSVWYRGIALGWMIAGTALTWAWSGLPPAMFLLSAGFFGGIAMALYCPLLLVANVRLLPPICRPGRLQMALLGGVTLFYVVFAVFSLWVIGRQVTGL